MRISSKLSHLTGYEILFLFYSQFISNCLVSGKIVEGELVTSERWVFLTRFCFLSTYGRFKYEIEYDPKLINSTITLFMYPDLQWNGAYRNPKAKTCQQKMDLLHPEEYQFINLDLFDIRTEAGCEKLRRPRFPIAPFANKTEGEQSFKNTILCKNDRPFKTVRERWWFIGVASCNSTQGLNLKYKFYMTNGNAGDYWHEHFSADELYILPVLTGFCFVYLFLLFTALIFAVELKCRQLFHITYKLFLISLGFQNVGIIMLCIAYGRYASNGVGLPKVKLTGRIFEALNEFVFILLILLLAKGFTVTRGRLRLASSIKLTIFCCCYFVIYGCLFFYEQYFFDPGLVVYIYASPAGYGLLILRLIGWLMFVYAIFFSLKHYPEKSSFYIPFFCIYSIWFVSGPVIIIISNHVIDEWVREKVSVCVEHACMFVGHIIFLCLTRPAAANKSFPYHVRTTQVGASFGGSNSNNNNSNTNNNNDPVEEYDSHSYYAPSYVDATTGKTIDIFTVSGIVQRGDGTVVNNTSLSQQPSTGSPLDVFSANYGLSQMIPTPFPVPPPKYTDAFPHEAPGQVAEMLMERDEFSETGDEEDENSRGDADDETRSKRISNTSRRNTIELERGEVAALDRENVYTI